METLRLISISLLLCISHAIAATIPEGMQRLDPRTQKSLKLYMSVKKSYGNTHMKGMLEVAKESPNICLRYLGAKALEEKTGPDDFSKQSQILGKVQLKTIFTDLAANPDQFNKDCKELKSAFGENVIKEIGDPYSEFITNEVNPLFQNSHHVYIKIKAAEHSNSPIKLIDLIEDPYINDENREQILNILKTKYSHLPDAIEKGLLGIFQTASTLSLKESCLSQLLTSPSNMHWYQSGLEIIEKETRAINPRFCPLLEKTKIPAESLELEKMKARLQHECRC